MCHVSRARALLSALTCVTTLSAGAAECYVQYDSSKCLKQAKSLQVQLDHLYETEEQMVLTRLKEYEPEFKGQVVASMRETNTGFAKFKDAACLSLPLTEGMSLRDSGVIADACKVEWRARRIGEIKRHIAHAAQ